MRLSYVLGTALTLGLATAVVAQQPANPQQRPTQTYPYPNTLYQYPDVAKSLNLTADQMNRLNQVTEQAQTRYRTGYDKFGNLTPAERATRIQELNRDYYNDWLRDARDVFNEEQLNRHRQLNLQYGGFNSLVDPEVQKRLNLNDQQRINLRENMAWSEQQLQEIHTIGATNREKGTKLYGDFQKEYETRFNKLLLPAQQKTWREMTGEAYRFQPSFVVPPR